MRLNKRCHIWSIFLWAFLAPVLVWAQVLPTNTYYLATSNLTSVALEAALHNTITNHTVIPYDASGLDTYDVVAILDQDPANANNVIEIYSGFSVAKSTRPNWNREHMYPESFGTGTGGTPEHSDLFNLRACDKGINSTRNNKYYDVSTGTITFPPNAPGSSYDMDSWEPRDADKGFVARACFYMSTRYDGTTGSTNLFLTEVPSTTSNKFAKLSTLLAWNRKFPPTDYERTRNGVLCSTYQHNRNPFIDNPDFADMIFLGVDGFTAWENDRFSTAELSNSVIAGANAAPLGDGVPNLAKYALGHDPHVFDASTILSVSNLVISSTNYLYITHHRNHYLSGVTLTYESSTDMQSWNDALGNLVSSSQIDTQKDLVMVRFPDSSQSQFVRLKMHRIADGTAILEVVPGSSFASSGFVGGPFSPISQTYTLSNSGGVTLHWTATNSVNWFDLSSTSGTLAPGANTTVTLSINTNANSLTVNAYADTVSFVNTTSGDGNTTRSVSLSVNDPTPALTVSPATGFAAVGNTGGPFNPSSQIYTLANVGAAPLNWTVSNAAAWLTLSATSGTLAGGGTTNITISINGNADSLATNTYSGTIFFANTTNGNGDTTRPATLTVNTATPIIVPNGATLVSESCAPTNGVLDPGEIVTLNFSLKDVGDGDASNLVATLLETGGVTSPSDPANYGVVTAGGAAVGQPFAFIVGSACGGGLTATLQVQDGATDLGTITYNFIVGQLGATFTQNFDGVTPPSLPTNWTTSATGAQSNWVTSTTAADSAPNAAYSPDPGTNGVNELDSPTFIVNSTSAQLTFRHNYSLAINPTNSSKGFDGGVLEIAIGGGSYQDIVAAGGSFVSGGYNTTLSTNYANPLAGRQAWSGNSGGFITTAVNLPAAAAGQSVQLRWRCGAGNPPLTSSGTLASWTFDGTSVPFSNADVSAPAVLVSGVVASNCTGGAAGTFQGNPSSGLAISDTGFTQAAGPPTGSYSYFAFTLTVTNGYQAALSSLSFDDRGSLTGPTNFTVQISLVANFSSTIYDSGAKLSHLSSSQTSFATETSALTNTGLTGTIYVRIYAYKAGSASGTWRIDNLNIQGNVSSGTPVGGAGWFIDSVSVNDFICCGQ